MTSLSPTPRRSFRVASAAALTLAMALAGPGMAWAAGAGGGNGSGGSAGSGGSGNGGSGTAPGAAGSTTGSEASLQIQAQELTGQIEANGVQLDQLDEEYNAAELQYLQLGSQVAGLEKAMAQTDRTAAATKRELKNQAVLDYITGGAPLITRIPVLPSNPNLATSYAEIIAGSQERAIEAYHQVMLDQVRQETQLTSARQQAAITLTAIEGDRAAATQTLAEQKSALGQVKGKLAVAVAEVEAQQQQAEQTAIETSFAQQGQNSTGQPSAGASPTTATTAAPLDPTQPVAPFQPVAPPTTTPPPPAAPVTTTGPPPTSPAPVQPPSGNSPAPGYQLAIAYARAQIGKPYQWGGAGPNSFDCSGLVMMAWEQAGVYFPHLAQDQYDMTERIAISNLLPGDLVFYGTPSDVYHVGLYIGGGDMIAAPETGQNVQIQSIYWSGLLGGGRVQS
jgi:peptidoglycan DL-endopeptidase CwlO